jgi:hypothetical protein
MATNPIGGTPSSVINPNRFPPAAAARVASRMLDRFNRDELSNAIEVLVTMLDVWDGDPDLETTGDDEPDDDAKGDTSWTEWHTRGRHKDNPGLHDRRGYQLREDDEDDDPDSEHDGCEVTGAEDDFMQHFGYGAGCPIADPGIADSGAMQEAHGCLSGPNYRDDQTQPLGPGHH